MAADRKISKREKGEVKLMKNKNINLEAYYPSFKEICDEVGVDYCASNRMEFIIDTKSSEKAMNKYHVV